MSGHGLSPRQVSDDAVALLGNLQTADYATTASGSEVLDAYEATLPADYAVGREDQGAGEQLTGSAGSVYFTITIRDGAFSVAFGTD